MSGLPVGSKTCIFDIDGSSDIDGKTMQPDVSFLGFPVEPARTRSFFADRSDSSRSPFPAGNLANATRNLTANTVSIGDASLSVESLENGVPGATAVWYSWNHRSNGYYSVITGKLRLALVYCVLVSWIGAAFPQAHSQDTAELLTVAEASKFTATSRFEDVVAFVDRCAREGNHVQLIDIGETVEGRPIVAAVVGNPIPAGVKASANETGGTASTDDRVVCLLLGNIHSGECAGKEALLMLLRDLTRAPDSPLLKNIVLIFVPNYNADGNERIGPGEFHRPGQLGPSAGMGLRENAQQLDLNRDFVKLEAPETRSLVRLINQYDVDVMIDLHTTNGSKHRYDLTYDFPHHPAVFPDIKQFMLSELLPTVTGRLRDQGIETFFYGNFDRRQTEWRTFGYEGRYSTEHAGLSNRIGILSEAYSYVSY